MNLVYCNNDASSRDVLLLAEGKIDVLRVGIGQNLDVLWVPVHRFDIMCVGRGPNRRSKRSPFCRRVPKKFKKEFCEKGPPPPLSSLFKGYTSQCCCCCFYSLSIMWRGHKLLYVYMFGSGSNKMAAGFFCTRRGGGWCATTCYIYAAVCVCV